MGKGVTAPARFARQLYLYGNGDGKRVTSVPELAKQSGLHEQTIRLRLPAWEKESEEILINTNSSGLALSLSAQELSAHKSDMIHLRDQINQCKFELDRLEDITAKLETWLDKFDAEDYKDALSIFDAWQRASGQKSSLRSQFLAMQKQWTSLSGIVDLKDIHVVREKEISKGKAKLDIKRMESEQGTRPANPLENSVFARPRRDRPEEHDDT